MKGNLARLGPAVKRELRELHGGQIRAESEGEGSTFTVVLLFSGASEKRAE